MRLIAGWLFPILLLLLGLVLFLPGLGTLDLWDLQEMRIAEAAREMLATEEYYKLQINFRPTWDLGPLAVWWQALGMQSLGIGEEGARLPNALLGCLALLSIFVIGRRLHEADFGFIWALLTFSPLAIFLLFRTGLAEPAYGFFLFLTVACTAFASEQRLRGGSSAQSALAGLFLGLAVLSDGISALVFMGILLIVVWLLNGARPLLVGADVVVLALAALMTTMLWFGYEWAANGPEFLDGLFNSPNWHLGNDDPGRTPLLPGRIALLLLGLFPTGWLAVGPLIRYREKDPADFRRWMVVLTWVSLVVTLVFPNMALLGIASAAYPLGYLATLYVGQPIRRVLTSGSGLWAGMMAVLFLMGIAAVFVPVLLAAKSVWLWSRLSSHGYLPAERWVGTEGLAGLILLAICVPVFRLGREQKFAPAVLVASLGLMAFAALGYPFLGKGAQQMVQGTYPSLFAKTAKAQGYAASVTFKSYAPLFYGARKPGLPCNGRPDSCFLKRPVPRPVYKVVPVWAFGSGRHLAGFEEVDRAGAYVLFKRFDKHVNY